MARRQNRISEARALFERAAQVDPTHAESRYNLAQLLAAAGDADAAAQMLTPRPLPAVVHFRASGAAAAPGSRDQ